MTDQPIQPFNEAQDVMKEILLLLAEKWPYGGMLHGDKSSATFEPRKVDDGEDHSAFEAAVNEVNLKLREIPLRSLVKGALALRDGETPSDDALDTKIPFYLNHISDTAKFRLQWNPEGHISPIDPKSPKMPDMLLIYLIREQT